MKAPKNLARYLARNFRRVSKEFNEKRPSTLAGILSLRMYLFNKIWGNDLNDDRCAALLYSFGPWDDLKISVMDGRYLPLPEENLPDSEAGLHELCQSLLGRTGDQTLRNRFIQGWSGKDLPGPALTAFTSRLWTTARNDPDYFDAVVRGNHGSAFAYLIEKRVPRGITADDALNMIYKMALIFSAHDVQATAGRVRRSMTRPLDWLMQGSAKRMMASTVFAVWRPAYEWLTLHLGSYRTNEETRHGKGEGKPSRHDDVQTIREATAPLLKRSELARSKRSERDALVGELHEFVSTEEDDFWSELRRSTGKFDNKQMSQVFYSDLTPLEVIAVAVINHIYVEATLKQQLKSSFNRALQAKARSELQIPIYREGDLPYGWRARAKLLIDDLRGSILKDVDHQSRRPEGERGESGAPAHDDTFIDGALEFLDETIKEVMLNHSANAAGRRLTWALITVMAAARFQR